MPLRLEVLAQLPLFDRLNKRELSDIAAVLVHGTASIGDTLIAEGAAPGTPLYVLFAGSAAVIKFTADGRRHLVGKLGAPNVFGEMDVLAQRPALASVVALEPIVFATLSAESVVALCEAGRSCILKVLGNLTSALRYRTVASNARLRTAQQSANPIPNTGSGRLGSVRHMLYSGWDTRKLA